MTNCLPYADTEVDESISLENNFATADDAEIGYFEEIDSKDTNI